MGMETGEKETTAIEESDQKQLEGFVLQQELQKYFGFNAFIGREKGSNLDY